MRVAGVVLDIPTRALDAAFTYLVPDGMDARVGQCVEVPFGHRPSIGYIVDISERPISDFGDIAMRPKTVSRTLFDEDGDVPAAPDAALATGLKPIARVLTESYFDEVGADMAMWIAREYVGTLPEAVRLFMPPGASPGLKRAADGSWKYVAPAVAPVDDRWAMLTDEGHSYVPPKRATRQAAVIEALREGEMRVVELGIEIGSVSSVLATLEKKGVVRVESRRRMRGVSELPERTGDIASLTAGQVEALEAIDSACLAGRGDVVVVDGVTGSGKTEVYLQAIRRVLERGRSACVLVPEISLTPQTVGRFRSRFGDLVAVLHSRLSAGERFDQWSLLSSGQAKVVVGARSALFAPMRDLGLIVIDEEHESSYKQGKSPRYVSRDVAARLARLRGAALVLGSASPSIETLHRCKTGVWRRVELPERASGRPLPPVQVVDLGREFSEGNRTMISRALAQALTEVVERGEKAVLLLNRRGFASFLLCRECGFVPECEQCSTSLTFHEGRRGEPGVLMCHHCGRRYPVPANCPDCGSPYLRQLGPGTQYAHDQLRALLGPDVPIVRMDADTTRTKGSHERLLGEFAAADGGVLLGTQMIAKGLDFPDVTLAGVLIADTTLKLPDFRAAERTFQLLEQVAGRAGRAQRDGKVVVQTYWPEHPAIVSAAAHDRSAFLAGELPTREEFGWPPFRRIANILIWGKDESAVSSCAMSLGAELGERLRELAATGELGDVSAWEIVGPSPCLLSKLRGDYRWHILVKGPPGADLPKAISPILARRSPGQGASVAVDVDPVDLF